MTFDSADSRLGNWFCIWCYW